MSPIDIALATALNDNEKRLKIRRHFSSITFNNEYQEKIAQCLEKDEFNFTDLQPFGVDVVCYALGLSCELTRIQEEKKERRLPEFIDFEEALREAMTAEQKKYVDTHAYRVMMDALILHKENPNAEKWEDAKHAMRCFKDLVDSSKNIV